MYSKSIPIIKQLNIKVKYVKSVNNILIYFNMTQVISNNESVAIEKTPSYILYSNLPWMIDELCPSVKIAVILRSPVDRVCKS